jgi:cytochrome c biogenesis protein CcmG, thiol:disulfide interchange protein DsbE
MIDLLDQLLPLLATWGVWIVGGLLAAALLGLWQLRRGRRSSAPPTWPRRLGMGVLTVAVLPLAFTLFLLLGPMASILDGVRHLSSVVGQPAPELAFHEVATGAPRQLSELQGKVVLVNLWATWCPPCREEMPDLDKLQARYADRGLLVLTVSDEERDLLQKFAAEHPLRTLNAYSQNLGWYDVPGRPLTFVIDRNGTVRHFLAGRHSYEDFEELVLPLLG